VRRSAATASGAIPAARAARTTRVRPDTGKTRHPAELALPAVAMSRWLALRRARRAAGHARQAGVLPATGA